MKPWAHDKYAQAFDQEFTLPQEMPTTNLKEVIQYLKAVYKDTVVNITSQEELWKLKGQVNLINTLEQKLKWDNEPKQ